MSLRNVAAISGSAFRDFLWPRRCSGCGLRGVWLCGECASSAPVWQSPWCARCGIPIEFPCHCQELSGSVHAARAVGQHVEWLQRGVQLFKYRDEMGRAELFAPMLAEVIADLPRPDLLVAVPLHRNRERERGYNQALLLAERLSAIINVPVVDRGAFVRIINTPHQTRLPREERQRNLAGAFVVQRPEAVTGKSILLIDDVTTSGATVSACALTLRNAEARQVTVASVSRALNVRKRVSS